MAFIGTDIGGTFTDLLLFDTASGAFWRHKTPSTPHDSSEGILNGVTAICADAGVAPKDIEFFLHGTTVATNAVLEGKIKGLDALAAAAKKSGKFDYDAKLPDLAAVDRYTLRIRLKEPDLRFLYAFAVPNTASAAPSSNVRGCARWPKAPSAMPRC